jgi:hypothetical protein
MKHFTNKDINFIVEMTPLEEQARIIAEAEPAIRKTAELVAAGFEALQKRASPSEVEADLVPLIPALASTLAVPDEDEPEAENRIAMQILDFFLSSPGAFQKIFVISTTLGIGYAVQKGLR